MKKFLDAIRAGREHQKNYFKEFSEETASRNFQLMRTICYAGIILFSVYFIVIKIFFNPWSESIAYMFPVPVFLLFLLAIRRCEAKEGSSHVMDATILVLLMYSFLLGVMIVLSIFPNPDIPSIYYHLFILAAPVLFILPTYIHAVILSVSYVVFAALVVNIKVASVIPHELFESFTALIMAGLIMVLMSQFRMQSDTLKRKYYELSQLDGLTHLLNKVSGVHLTKQYILQIREKEHFAVLFLDLDNFKKINDTYGHLVGDDLLRAVSETLYTSCRATDIVCRFGGDEFLVVMKNIPNKDTATAKAETIRSRINEISIEAIPKVTCSMGVFYLENAEGQSLETILSKVDEALYSAKRGGKNRYHMVEL